jgi:hypothetical protein
VLVPCLQLGMLNPTFWGASNGRDSIFAFCGLLCCDLVFGL